MPNRVSVHRSALLAIPLTVGAALAVSSCHMSTTAATIGTPGGEVSVPGNVTGNFTFHLDWPVQEVWLEMRRAFRDLGIPVADEASQGTRAFVRSERTTVPGNLVSCRRRPGEGAARTPAMPGYLRADLEDRGTGRTRAVLQIDLQPEDLDTPRLECTSLGTIERQVVERTEERLARRSGYGTRIGSPAPPSSGPGVGRLWR